MKMVVAVTDIKYNDLRIKAGEPIPVDQFDKDTLVKLYEIGSIDKVEMDEEEASGLTSEDLKDAGTNVAAPKPESEEVPVEPPVDTPAETAEVKTEAPVEAEVKTEAPAEAPAETKTETPATTTTAPKTTSAKSSGGTK